MKDETQGADGATDSPIDDAAAEAAFAEGGATADQQVSARSDEGGIETPGAKGQEDLDKGTEGDVTPPKGKEKTDTGAGKPADEAKPGDEVTPDAAKTEAEQLAVAQQEAEERAVVAAEAEKVRKAQEVAAQQSAAAPIDATAIAAVIRERIKGIKLTGYDNFEAFEKEYGAPLTEAISAIAAEAVRAAVAPMVQEQAQSKVAAAHQEFVNKIVEIGHADVAQIEKSPEFWAWIDKPENKNLKYLVEKADIKGTDMVLRAYKSEKGIATGKPAEKPLTEREKLVAATKEAQARADKVHTATGRRQASIPKVSDDPEGVSDEDAAQAIFDETVKEQNKRNGIGAR